METNFSPYVQKLVETIEYIDGKHALLFIEQLEKTSVDDLPGWIDTLYAHKEHIDEVLQSGEACNLSVTELMG